LEVLVVFGESVHPIGGGVSGHPTGNADDSY